MRLILTRHGQTHENLRGTFTGQKHGRLTRKGIRDAKKTALRLRDEKIDFIYSSDLKRAAETAKEIARYHPNARVRFVTEMREKDLGELEGTRKADMGMDPNELKAAFIEPEKGESTKEMYERAKGFIKFLKSNHAEDTVLLVGHNGINLALVAALLRRGWKALESMQPMENTSISIFQIHEGRTKRVLFNDTSHLEN